MRKGFSVFTPMVGIIIIAITMLIVSSIIESERINMGGTLHSYRSSQMAGLATEVQNRIIEEIRGTIVAEISEADVMNIKVIGCPNEDLIYSERVRPGQRYDCWNNSQTQTYLTARNKLVGITLLETSIGNTLRRILSKYELVDIEYLDPDLAKVTGDVSFINCDWKNPSQCKDGRMKIELDFTALENIPIAEVKTESKILTVFLPGIKKEYMTSEPYGLYSLSTADMFQDFWMLNRSWHYAGDENHPWDDTDGSAWYHYNYVIHQRYGGDSPSVNNEYGTGWTTGFWVDNKISQTFEEGETLRDFLIDSRFSTLNERKLVVTEGEPPVERAWKKQQLRVDQVQKDTKNKYLLDFVSGDLILSIVNPLQDYAMSNFVSQRVDYTARSSKWFDLSYFLPGGYLDAGRIYGTRDTNCLTGQRADEVLDSIMIDSSESYDLKIEEVEEKFKKMVNTIKNSAVLISSMGYGAEDPVFNLTIESKQFYAEGNNTGGDNWECGQYLMRYLPALPGSCGAMQQRGNTSYFLSSPLDFNCKTKTLYRVEETYRINRNTHQNPSEPSKTAFIVTYVESKENLRKPDDQDTNVLWEGSLLETAAIKETPFVRHCVYSMDSKRYELTKQCEWEEFELLEDIVRWNRA